MDPGGRQTLACKWIVGSSRSNAETEMPKKVVSVASTEKVYLFQLQRFAFSISPTNQGPRFLYFFVQLILDTRLQITNYKLKNLPVRMTSNASLSQRNVFLTRRKISVKNYRGISWHYRRTTKNIVRTAEITVSVQ